MLARDRKYKGSLAVARALVIAGAWCLGALSCGTESERNAFDPPRQTSESDASPPALPDAKAPISACEAATLRGAPLGCEYLVFSVPDGSSANEGCTAVFISNPTDRPSRIEITRDGIPLDVGRSARRVNATMTATAGYEELLDQVLPPGASAVVAVVQNALAKAPITESWGECPFPPLLDESKRGVHDMSDAAGFVIRSSEPTFATYVQPYDYGWRKWTPSPATTALRSVGSWDARNVDVGVYMPGRPVPQHEREGNALYDDMAAFLVLGSVSGAHVHVGGADGAGDFDLPPGRVRRIKRDDLLIGAAITADTPISAFVGSPASLLPYNYGGTDPVLNQIPPLRAWSSEYVAVRYPDRYAESPDAAIYRIVGGTDGTKLSYEPERPDGAPDAIGAGQLATFISGASFIVRSQDDAHAFYASVAMTSYEYVQPQAEWESGIQGRGDPELVSLVPRAEFGKRFAFLTEHSYPDVHLVLVRAKAEGVFHPVTLGCAGEVSGWRALGVDFETTTVTLSKGEFEPQSYSGGSCHNGPHTMRSEGPFTGYVWGWGHQGAFADNPDADGGGGSFGFALYGTADAADLPGH